METQRLSLTHGCGGCQGEGFRDSKIHSNFTGHRDMHLQLDRQISATCQRASFCPATSPVPGRQLPFPALPLRHGMVQALGLSEPAQ